MGWGGRNKQLSEASERLSNVFRFVRCSLRDEAEVFISPDMRLAAVLRQFCSMGGGGVLGGRACVLGSTELDV